MHLSLFYSIHFQVNFIQTKETILLTYFQMFIVIQVPAKIQSIQLFETATIQSIQLFL